MDGDKSVTAHFSSVTYQLTMAVDPAGSGTTNPAVGVHTYAAGVQVTVTALPAAGYAFDHWSGACSGSGACQVTMDGNRLVIAHFVKLPPNLSLTKETDSQTADPGNTISYQLSYANAGAAATGVVIAETVPAHTTFNPTASTPGWVCLPDGKAGSSCTFTLGALAGGASGSVVFAVTLDHPLPADVAEISNTAQIGDDGSSGLDPDPNDNAASVSTPIKRYRIYLPLMGNNR
jgi:uncharacterized repeat protein (TIGR01451 family)